MEPMWTRLVFCPNEIHRNHSQWSEFLEGVMYCISSNKRLPSLELTELIWCNGRELDFGFRKVPGKNQDQDMEGLK